MIKYARIIFKKSHIFLRKLFQGYFQEFSSIQGYVKQFLTKKNSNIVSDILERRQSESSNPHIFSGFQEYFSTVFLQSLQRDFFREDSKNIK